MSDYKKCQITEKNDDSGNSKGYMAGRWKGGEM
jgi:hypothetical protein